MIELSQILGTKKFDHPKPSQTIKHIIDISTNKEDIILDSFAGSGTTAHAVLNLNKQDGGNRKFILIEMEDYANEITAERVKRVIKGYGEGNGAVAGSGGSFDFYQLGQPLFLEGEILNEAIGEARIRQYIWYSETRSAFTPPASGQDSVHFLGAKDDTAYYFFYHKERLTTLNYDFLETVKTRAGQYVIYADNCTLERSFLQRNNIIFKKIPRDITRF